MEHLSHSQINVYFTCRYKYYLNYILGLEVKPKFKSEPLKAGGFWDKLIGLAHECITKDDVKNYKTEHELKEYTIQKVKALYHAYRDFVKIDYRATYQEEVFRISQVDKNNMLKIKGVCDIAREKWFEEYKLTSRPDFYIDNFSVFQQVGTYFLCNEEFEACRIKITKIPNHKMNDYEDSDEFYERVYASIVSRPKTYFIDYDKKQQNYGTVYLRDDFPVDILLNKYIQVYNEITNNINNNEYFYQNYQGCHAFGYQCDYLDICKVNRKVLYPPRFINNEKYQRKEKSNEGKE